MRFEAPIVTATGYLGPMHQERIPPWDNRLRQAEVGETRLHIASFPRPEHPGTQIQRCSRCHEVIGWDAVEVPDFGWPTVAGAPVFAALVNTAWGSLHRSVHDNCTARRAFALALGVLSGSWPRRLGR